MAATGDSGSGRAARRAAPPRVLPSGAVPVAATLALILLSAFAVIRSSHSCRQLYATLQELEATRWHLQEEYGRLLLEQSTWASPQRVEKVAQGKLEMVPPALDDLQVVRP